MVRLSTTDAAILARVAKYRTRSPQRSRDLLTHAGEDAKVIGDLLIRDRAEGADDDHLRAADDIRRWAGKVAGCKPAREANQGYPGYPRISVEN